MPAFLQGMGAGSPSPVPSYERHQPKDWGTVSSILKRSISAVTVSILAGSALFLGSAPASAASYCGPGHLGVWSAGNPILQCSATPKTAVPSISGIAMQGMTLGAAPGTTWTAPIGKGFPVQPPVTFQWQRNGVPITGAVARTYKLTATDVGRKITVVMLNNIFDGRLRISWTSASTGAVIAPTVLNVTKPTVRGLAISGRTLTATVGTWRVAPTRYTYQWLRNGIAIRGATASTYRLTTIDKGKRVSVKVVAVRAGYISGSAISGATALVR